MPRVPAVVAAAALLLPLLPVAAGAVPEAARATRAPSSRPTLAVTGYALGGTSTAVIAASAKALTTVTVDGVTISADGAGVSTPDPNVAAVRRRAHAQGLRAELLVSNYSDKLSDFNPRSAHALLSSPTKIQRLADTVAGYVAAGHFDGANIDLELVRKQDATGLVDLASALQQAMPARKSVSIDISAARSVAGYLNHGYALGQLASVVDVVQVMAYDQHGPTWSKPGPIGDLRWQKRALKALLSVVPRSKVDLGQAGYGYTWPRKGTGGSLTDRAARARVKRDGATAVWHRAAGEWSATLSDGTRMWWADARSYKVRKKLATRMRLHGLAVWVLGSADPLR